MSEPENALSFKVDRIMTRNDRYERAAYPFVVEAVRFAHEAHQTRGTADEHLGIDELLHSIRIYALCEYGPLAKSVLNRWNVMDTEDFGRIVFLLAEEGEFELGPDDELKQFRDVYEFDEALVKPFKPNSSSPPTTIPVLDDE